MKLHLGLALVCLGIASGTCSEHYYGGTLIDPGAPGDLIPLDAAVDPRDLGSTLADLALPSDSSAPDAAVAWSSLRFIAGGPGGAGHADDSGRLARFSGPVGLAADGAGNSTAPAPPRAFYHPGE